MTAAFARQRTAARLGVAGAALGVLAGLTQAAVGSRIPDWTGNKASPVGLGLLTVLLSVVALGAASTLQAPSTLPAGRRAAVAIGLLVPGALCFSTVGRLWYPPGILILAAFGFTLAAGGTSQLHAVIRTNWTRGLVSLLGGFEMLMAVSAGPVTTIAVGIIGGAALTVAPWLTGRKRTASVALLLIGTLPFAALTWWSLVSPLLAVVALAIGLMVAASARAVHRLNPGSGRRPPVAYGSRRGGTAGLAQMIGEAVASLGIETDVCALPMPDFPTRMMR